LFEHNLPFIVFFQNTALEQSARFFRKNRPRSAALQRAGANHLCHPVASSLIERSGVAAPALRKFDKMNKRCSRRPPKAGG
jgi:hypothetical protein